MSERILQKYVNRGTDAPPDAPAENGEDAESFGSFGFIRGVRDRAIALELRQKTGRILAVNYAFIGKFEFDPAIGITLHCGNQLIRIKGRNLNGEIRPNVRLFQGITRFRVPWIQEAERAISIQASKDAVVVGTAPCAAYKIDSKIDDGIAITGAVTAQALITPFPPPFGSVGPAYSSSANPDTITTCFNSSSGSYSIAASAGSAGVCALSFQFQ